MTRNQNETTIDLVSNSITLMKSGRGGSRPNSGRPSKYSTSDVVTIKVPRSLKTEIEEVAHLLDSGEKVVFLNELLKGVKTYKLHGKQVVRVCDLLEKLGQPVEVV